MDTTHTFPLPFDEPSAAVEQTTAISTASAAPALIWPDSDQYDAARQAWNLHADQRPACICVARTVQDVQAAVRYARDAGLKVAPQTTGHLGSGLPSLEDTLLLKTALHDGEVQVDPVKPTARIKAGAKWGDVVEAVTPHGLAVMHGSSPTVGAIGYLLGGGLSFYGRKHGLAVNHVRALDVVTPDGVLRHVDAEHNRDLFYAIRGGGGGFAIVTAVEIGLLPYSEVAGGALFFAAADVRRVLRTWLGWSAQASDDITTTFRVLNLPPLPDVPEPLHGTSVCVNGVALDPAQAEQLESRLRYAATPILGGFGPMPTAAVARLHMDPEDPVPCIGDGMLLHKVDDWAIDSFVRVAMSGSPLLAAEIRQLGGALASPPPGAGARGHLEGRYLLFGVGLPGAPAPAAELEAYLDAYLEAMRPWATGTRFLSFAERLGSLRTCVPDGAYARLSRIRAAVDPDGMLVASHMVDR